MILAENGGDFVILQVIGGEKPTCATLSDILIMFTLSMLLIRKVEFRCATLCQLKAAIVRNIWVAQPRMSVKLECKYHLEVTRSKVYCSKAHTDTFDQLHENEHQAPV